jgi:hypothetical protein
MSKWNGNRCQVCGLKTQGDDLCNKHYEEAERMSSRTQQIKDILVSLAVADKLPLDLSELDPAVFEPALAGAVFPGYFKDRYVSLEVPAGTDCVQVKLDDEGVVIDAYLPKLDRARGEHYHEPCASTWKTYQMMEDGEE